MDGKRFAIVFNHIIKSIKLFVLELIEIKTSKSLKRNSQITSSQNIAILATFRFTETWRRLSSRCEKRAKLTTRSLEVTKYSLATFEHHFSFKKKTSKKADPSHLWMNGSKHFMTHDRSFNANLMERFIKHCRWQRYNGLWNRWCTNTNWNINKAKQKEKERHSKSSFGISRQWIKAIFFAN